MSFCFIRKFQSVFIHIFDFYVKFIRVGSIAALLLKNIRGFCNSVNAKAPFSIGGESEIRTHGTCVHTLSRRAP